MQNKWNSLPKPARRLIRSGGIIQLVLLGTAHGSLSARDPHQINGSKGMWRAATLVSFVGPVAYFAFGRRHH